MPLIKFYPQTQTPNANFSPYVFLLTV